MNRRTSAILAALSIGLFRASAEQPATPPPQFPPAATHDPPVAIDTTGAPSLGPADAPVTIVEFLDFQCPYCSRAEGLLRSLLERNPKTVRLVVMAFPLPAHEHAFGAAEAARAAQAQGKFWEMHDALLRSEDLDPEKIRRIAASIGLDMKDFDAALTGREHRTAVAQEAYRGRRAGVDATPTLFVNGYRVGIREERTIQELVDDLAAGRAPRQLPPPPPPMEALDTVRSGDPVRGNALAPVTLVEFADFHCPYCREAQPRIREILALYPGQVRLVYKQFPLPRTRGDSLLAARASLAAHSQGKFWEMHDKLFAAGPEADGAAVETMAAEIGLDLERFRADLASRDTLRAVREDVAMARRADVRGTPTLFVNNREVGHRDIGLIRAMIDDELRAVGQPVAPRLER